jgi:Methane oxygenase PmoA
MEVKQKVKGLKQKAKAWLTKKFKASVQMFQDFRVPATVFLLFAFGFLLSACQQQKEVSDHRSDYVSLIENDSLTRLDVFIDGKYFTSYLYADTILRKPVLFPLTTGSEVRVTRGYPFAPNAGERIDHPHHYGLWFNHGDVNGIDFWNSSVERKKGDPRYGSINHVKFLKKESGNIGTLKVEKEWRSSTDTLVLSERTQYLFSGDANTRIITHTTTLTAPEADVLFTDSKEGMFAIRVRRELEIPADDSTVLLTENLTPSSEVVSDEGVSGRYRNSNGLEGYPAVWGKRAKWMQLSGIVNHDSISICIFDHPENLNHPPHWMARDYGLYSVNPMGSKLYTEGKEQLNFRLKKGESVTFRHQVVIIDGTNPAPAKIEGWYNEFVTSIKSQ